MRQVVEDFGLLRFLPLAIEDRASVARVLEDVDKANGCAFSGLVAAAGPMPPELIYGAGVKGRRAHLRLAGPVVNAVRSLGSRGTLPEFRTHWATSC